MTSTTRRTGRARRRAGAAGLAAGVGVALTAALLPAVPAAAAPTSTPTVTVEQEGATSGSARPDPLRQALRRVVRAGAVGVTAEVVDRGDVWRGAAGSAQLRPTRPASEQAHFRAASITKQLTTVLALQLVENGRWTLDTTIGDVMPKAWPERGDVTLRQLLTHTSGIPEMTTPLLADAVTERQFVRAISARRTDRELLAAAKSQEYLFEPGTDMAYSNTNFVVVGMMLKNATGRSMPALMRQRILVPARMTESRYGVDRNLAGPRLKEYGFFEPGQALDLSSFHPSLFSSSGALVSTARDLNRFQLALSRGRLVGAPLVRQMRSLLASDPDVGLDYGLGSYRLPDPCTEGGFIHGHDGATFGTLSMSFSSPDGRRRVAVSMSGRDYDPESTSGTALVRFVYTAFAQGCGAPVSGRTAPRALPPLLDLTVARPEVGRG